MIIHYIDMGGIILRRHLATWVLFGLFLGLISHICTADNLPGRDLAEVSTPIPTLAVNQAVTLTALGDVVMHLPIVDSCFNATDNTYDFRPVFTEIKPELDRTDLAVAVLEAPLAGPESNYTGYPLFNSPGAIANALQWAGIDLVFLAHNHCLDRGVIGLQKTMAYLDQIGLPYTGCNASPGQKRYRIMETKGLKLAFLSYTTTTNGIRLPAGKEWMVNTFDYAKIAADITDAKQNGADGIIFALHTGTEYQRYPSDEQQDMVQHLLALGVDIVLGSHVHVIQPLELRNIFIPACGATKTRLIVYSLGNLLSNQRWRYSDCGLMVQMKLENPSRETGVTVTSENHRPLWVNRFTREGKTHYFIKLVNEKDESADPDLDTDGRARMIQVWEETAALINDWNQ
jgi:poly-gamma-glutamate synthesis protein (capsule biosynthesis protein)